MNRMIHTRLNDEMIRDIKKHAKELNVTQNEVSKMAIALGLSIFNGNPRAIRAYQEIAESYQDETA